MLPAAPFPAARPRPGGRGWAPLQRSTRGTDAHLLRELGHVLLLLLVEAHVLQQQQLWGRRRRAGACVSRGATRMGLTHGRGPARRTRTTPARRPEPAGAPGAELPGGAAGRQPRPTSPFFMPATAFSTSGPMQSSVFLTCGVGRRGIGAGVGAARRGAGGARSRRASHRGGMPPSDTHGLAQQLGQAAHNGGQPELVLGTALRATLRAATTCSQRPGGSVRRERAGACG
jgi:hypothetical protein